MGIANEVSVPVPVEVLFPISVLILIFGWEARKGREKGRVSVLKRERRERREGTQVLLISTTSLLAAGRTFVLEGPDRTRTKPAESAGTPGRHETRI